MCDYARTHAFPHASLGAQTKMIAGASMNKLKWHQFDSLDPPDTAMVALACVRLRRFAFVGISDYWEASMCLFHEIHGGKTSTSELVNVRQGNYSSDPESIKELDCGDTADELLFECGMKVFLEGLKQHPQCMDLVEMKDFGLPAVDDMLQDALT